MTKDICLTIKSTQTIVTESETTELFTNGTMLLGKDKDKIRLRYDESEATGFDGCSVDIDLQGSKLVTITRSGRAPSSLIIEKGRKHHCHYGTEFGEFMVGITTDEINNSITKDGGELYLKYTIDINSGLLSENEMTITVENR